MIHILFLIALGFCVVLFLFLDFTLCVYMCVYALPFCVCTYMCECIRVCVSEEARRGIWPLELELQVVAGHLPWVLGANSWEQYTFSWHLSIPALQFCKSCLCVFCASVVEYWMFILVTFSEYALAFCSLLISIYKYS